MSEQEFEQYLDAVSARMGLSSRRREEIREELRSHLDEHWEQVTAGGGDRERAIRGVLDDFGPPERLAAGIALPYRRRVRRIAGLVAASLAMTVILHMQFRASGPSAGNGASTAGIDNWAGTSIPLLADLAAITGPAVPIEDQSYAALRKVIPLVKANDAPLAGVVAQLSETSGANIWVNWSALQAEGIDPDSPVSMNLENVPLGRILELLCAQFDAEGLHLTFGQSDNVIEISTFMLIRSPEPETDVVQMVYDVRAVIEAPWPEDKVTRAEDPDADELNPLAMEEKAERLVELICNTISPEDWRRNGGDDASADYFAGLLVIRAPDITQAKVDGLLTQLAGHLAPQSVKAPPPSSGAPFMSAAIKPATPDTPPAKPAKDKEKDKPNKAAKRDKNKGH